MAEQQQLYRHGALAAWYETAKSALYLNRTLREWLESYAEHQRPEAAKLALLHGVTCLRKSFGSKVLSLEQLKHATGQGQHAIALQEELPMLHQGVVQIRQLLDGFDQDLSLDNTIQQPEQAAGFSQNHKQHARQQDGLQDAGVETQPACLWHSPQDIATQQHPQHQVYPSWWGHHAPQLVPQQIRASDHQPRPAPCLAYSVKQQPQAGKPLHSNDLVTAAYLDVPSSRYAPGRPVSAARRALTWKGPADKPTADSSSAQIGEGKENSSGTAEVEQKGSKLKQHVMVNSRVKEQLQQAQSLHQQRGRARQQRLQAALGPRRPAAPQRFRGMPGQRSSEGHYRTEQPPADIADSILSNPWTAALLQGDADRPQLYANSLALTRIGIGSWAREPAHAHGSPQSHSQTLPQPQPIPEKDVTANLSASETDTASLHSSHGEDDRKLDAGSDRQATGSCSSEHEDGAGCDMHSGDSNDHRQGRSGSTGQQQDKSKPADPVLHSKPNAAPGSQHADARTSSSERGSSDRANSPTLQPEPDAAWGRPYTDASIADQGSSDGAKSVPERGSSNKGRSSTGNLDTGGSQLASCASVPCAQPARYIDRAVAFTDRHGEQTQGLQQNSAAPDSEEADVKDGRQRGFASWIGDFGHLEGPRFNKQQGRAWQAHMRSKRDQPLESCSNPHTVAEDSDMVCDSERGDEDKSTLSSTSDGRWEFAKILKDNL